MAFDSMVQNKVIFVKVGELIEGRWKVVEILGHRPDHPTKTLFVQDVVSGDEFAVKTPNEVVDFRNIDEYQHFRREAIAWMRLGSHPHIVRAQFLRIVNSSPFLFLEFMEGGDLSLLVRSGELVGQVAKVVSFALQLCEALLYAAQRGIHAHGDINPHNCLLDQDGSLKLTDFGMSRVVTDGGKSGTSMPRRSPFYMAPEQFLSPGDCDVSSDIYQFGILLFEMTVGRVPFPGTSWKEIMTAHLTEPPPAISCYSVPLHAIVSRCLAKLPVERFQNFEAVHRELAILAKYYRVSRPQNTVSEKPSLEAARRGSNFLVLGEYNSAIAELTSAINAPQEIFRGFEYAVAAAPESTAAVLSILLHHKALALQQLGRYAEALFCAERALQVNEDYLPAWLSKGQMSLECGYPVVASFCFEHVLEMEPKNELAWLLHAISLDCADKRNEAQKCLQTAACRFPDRPVFKLSLDQLRHPGWFPKEEDRKVAQQQMYEAMIKIIFDNTELGKLSEAEKPQATKVIEERLSDLIMTVFIKTCTQDQKAHLQAICQSDPDSVEAEIEKMSAQIPGFLGALNEALKDEVQALVWAMNYRKPGKFRVWQKKITHILSGLLGRN
jgi:serine/threonine protein kinase